MCAQSQCHLCGSAGAWVMNNIFYLFRVTLDLNLLKRVLLLKMIEESMESTKNIKCYTQNFNVEWLNDPEFKDWLEQDKKN